MTDFLVYISPSCHHLSKQGKEYITAYIFVKLLSSFATHPILFDFDAHTARIRHLLHFTPHKFSKLLNLAISLDLCRYEGKSLRIISKTQERKLFHLKSSKNYESVKASDVQAYIQVQILKHGSKIQQSAFKYKSRSAATNGAAKFVNKIKLNPDITMSCRNAAKLLNFSSYSSTSNLLSKLSSFGLVLTPNRTEISLSEFKELRHQGNFNARKNKETDGYYLLKASTVHFKPFYPKPIIKTKGVSFFMSDNW